MRRAGWTRCSSPRRAGPRRSRITGGWLREDPAYADKAARVSALTKDISEFLVDAGLPLGEGRGLTVAYHAACSLQHGQKVVDAPKRLLAGAGYAVRTPIEAHLCCGSAGTYNILQPEIAGQLGDRKVANIERLRPDVIATGNIGCAMQIGQRTGIPVVHTVELVDWATGGPIPPALATRRRDDAKGLGRAPAQAGAVEGLA